MSFRLGLPLGMTPVSWHRLRIIEAAHAHSHPSPEGGKMVRNAAYSVAAIASLAGAGLLVRVAMVSVGSQDSKSLRESVYSPYPKGLIPQDLESETNRVNTEIDRL